MKVNTQESTILKQQLLTSSFQGTKMNFRFLWDKILVNKKTTRHLGSLKPAINSSKFSSDTSAAAHIKVCTSGLSAKVQDTLNAMRTRRIPNLIQEVDLCDCVGCLPRVLHQQCNESHKGIQVVVALGSNHGGVGCRIVLLLGQGSIADLNTHFGAKTEKTGDQVICFQDPLLVHLTRKGKEVSTTATDSSFYNLFQTTHPLQSKLFNKLACHS